MSISIPHTRPPPPPHRGTFDRRLTIPALLLAAATGALLLTACDSPTGENPNTNTGKVTPPKVTPPKVTPPIVQPTKTYTTTVKGKVITPARAADPAKGSVITTARVWASTDPAQKVDVGADGSYSLQVAGHSGSFTITAEYTATGNRNYKTSHPKTVTTKGPAIENQDIALEYGYTTEFTAKASLSMNTTSGGRISSGVTVVITAEGGHEVGRGITSGAAGPSAVITVDHPGRVLVTASRDGYRGDSNSERVVITTTERTRNTGTLSLYQNVP